LSTRPDRLKSLNQPGRPLVPLSQSRDHTHGFDAGEGTKASAFPPPLQTLASGNGGLISVNRVSGRRSRTLRFDGPLQALRLWNVRLNVCMCIPDLLVQNSLAATSWRRCTNSVTRSPRWRRYRPQFPVLTTRHYGIQTVETEFVTRDR
jgi:hypothetical protein